MYVLEMISSRKVSATCADRDFRSTPIVRAIYRPVFRRTRLCRNAAASRLGACSFRLPQLSNGGVLNVTGVDLQADYSFELPPALSLVASWLFERTTQVEGFAPIDCAGTRLPSPT